MKKLPNKKLTLYKNPIFIWTILLNISLFIGLYLYFRTDIIQTLATSHLDSHQTVQPAAMPSNNIAKNIPLSSPTVELIPQTTPNMTQASSTLSGTALPTLLEPETATTSATATTPIVVTNIVKIPQKTTNIVEYSHQEDSPQTGKKIAPSLAKHQHHNSDNQNIASTKTEPHHYPAPPESDSITGTSNADGLLTDRDIPSQTHAGKSSENHGHQALEAKTAELSEAINQVKRLNQQNIDKGHLPKEDK